MDGLDGIDRQSLGRLIEERRGAEMSWLHLRPKALPLAPRRPAGQDAAVATDAPERAAESRLMPDLATGR